MWEFQWVKPENSSITFSTITSDLSNLCIHVERLIHLAHKDHIHQVYHRAWVVFNKHLDLYHKDLEDIAEMDMMEFITFLSLGQLAPSTISSYVSRVHHHLRIRNLPTFEDNFLLKLVLKGVSNSNQQTDVCLPISLDILQKMIVALPMVASSPYEASLYAAVLSVGFFGLSCPGEMVLSEHALLATNMYISSTKVVCLLPTSKAHKGPFPQSVYLYKQPNVACQVTAFVQYAKVRPPKGGQFFIKVDGNPINRGDLDNILHRLSELLHLPHQHFKSHSLRIGRSSHLHLSGVPVQKIKEIGRWSSNVLKKYIKV